MSLKCFLIALSCTGLALAFLATPAHAETPEHAAFLKELDADIAALSKKRDFRSQVKLIFELHVRAKERGMPPEVIADIDARIKALDDRLDEENLAPLLCGPRKITSYKDLFAEKNFNYVLKLSNEDRNSDAKRRAYTSGEYSGKDEDLVAFFNQHAWEEHVPKIDCLWLEKSPGLFNVEKHSYHGLVYANIECAHPPFQLPKSIELNHLAGILTGWSSRTEEMMIYAPQAFRYLDKKHALLKESLLKWWSLYSLWNFEQYKQLQPAWQKAISDLEKYYISLPVFKGVKEFDVRSSAILALQSNMFLYNGDFNLQQFRSKKPPMEIREAILFNEPLDKIRDNFDRCAPQKTSDRQSKIADYLREDPNEKLGKPEPAPFLAVRRPDVLQLLLSRCGYSALEKNGFGKTLLMNAAQYGPLQSAKIILKSIAADERKDFANLKTDGPLTSDLSDWMNPIPNFQAMTITHGNRTALMYAAENASEDFIHWLLAQGADKCMTDSEGLTAADYMVGNAPDGQVNPHLDIGAQYRLAGELSCPAATKPKLHPAEGEDEDKHAHAGTGEAEVFFVP